MLYVPLFFEIYKTILKTMYKGMLLQYEIRKITDSHSQEFTAPFDDGLNSEDYSCGHSTCSQLHDEDDSENIFTDSGDLSSTDIDKYGGKEEHNFISPEIAYADNTGYIYH